MIFNRDIQWSQSYNKPQSQHFKNINGISKLLTRLLKGKEAKKYKLSAMK